MLFGFNVLVLEAYLTPKPSNASGFALYTSGATELALNDSVVAHTEGAASNYFNPALLPELEGTQIEIGTIVLKLSSDFKGSASGEKSGMETNTFYPSTFFISHKINDIFSAGIGINSTFGLGTEWPDDWEGRYLSTNSELETFNINPNLAWKVSNTFIMAVGLDLLIGETTCEQKIDPLLTPFPALPDAHSKMTGDGEGYGYNLGLIYKVAEDLAFGMSYRSGIKLKLKGDLKWTQPGAPGAGVLVDTGAKVDLDLPAQCFAGLSYRPSENIILEIGGKWEGWSSYKNIKIRADQAVFPGGSNTYTTPKNWRDVYGFNVGIKYILDPTLSIAAGYLHEGNPVPSSTFEPSVPVSDKDNFSFGIRKKIAGIKVALAYAYDKYGSRKKNNSVVGYSATGVNTANGEYKHHIHIVGMSVSYAF